MKEGNKETVTLLDELGRLVEAGIAGDFGITLNKDGLTEEESKIILLINTAMSKYRKTFENDLMTYKMSSDAKSEFLTDMSQEMRTPLNAIIGLTGLILEDNELDEETNANLEKVHSSGTTLLGIVNNILDIATVRIGSETVENLKLLQYLDEKRYQFKKLERISLPDARVLVVDDNITNLDVAKGLLQPYEIMVDRVDTGEKAIDAITAEPGRYDAIFMDQIMPGMDGVKTTQHIRELNTEYAKNIPIIALTALATVSNEEMLLNSGFQAFLSKPIDIFRLDAVIKRWIRDKDSNDPENTTESSKAPGNPDTGGKSSPEAAHPLHGKEVTGLNMTEGIRRFGGDADIYLNVLRSFTVNTRNILKTIVTGSDGDRTNYQITVHSIKGSCASISANLLAGLAKNLEDAAAANNWDFVTENNAPFIATAGRLISDLEAMFALIDSQSAKQKKEKPDTEVLKKLKSACESYDMDAVDSAMDELTGYSYESDEDLIDWLHENIEKMNFTEIIERLTDYLG